MVTPQPEILELDFIHFEIYTSYIIGTVKEGCVISTEERNSINAVFHKYFENKPFGYISNRVNDYTVDPISYLKPVVYPLFLGIAVVCYSEESKEIALFEKKFHAGSFETFETLAAAERHMQMELKNFKKAGL